MSNVLKTVATVAGVVALVATGVGALGGLGLAKAALLTIGTVGRVATGVALAASIGASATQSKPGVKGNANEITIGANMDSPYAMGRCYPRLAMVHDMGYGGTVSDVKNPYRSWPFIISTGGPIEEIEAIQADFTTISFDATSGGMPGGEATGYYENFLWVDSQLGACPEASALAGPFGAFTGWGASHKLSGKAGFMVTAKFDKKGKRFASGVPQWGAVVKGALVYDQRQDDTYAGGAGDCRALDESTYVGGAAALNPSCHGVTYALGRWQGTQGPDGGPRKVFGCGFGVVALDWPAWTEFANVCDANGWKIGGTIFEPGSRWDNLKRICACGGGTPVWSGGKLSVIFPRPRVALDTIVAEDLADGEIRIPAMKPWRARLNGIIPQYPSEPHHWELVDSDAVIVETYVTEDGEEKVEPRAYELVPYKNQAAQLAAYDLTNGREISGIVLPCKPRLMEYRLGDALAIGADLAEETGLAAGTVVVIIGRDRDPATCTVTLTLETETAAKHAYALGRTGTAPPTQTLPTHEELDETAFGVVPSAPDAGDWAVEGTSLSSAGGAIPALVITGAPADTDGLTGIQFDYRVSASYLIREGEAAGWILREDGGRVVLEDSAEGNWIGAMLDAPATVYKEIVSVTPGTTYEVSIQYMNKAGLSARLILGPVEVGVLIPAESVAVGDYDAAALADLESRIAALEP